MRVYHLVCETIDSTTWPERIDINFGPQATIEPWEYAAGVSRGAFRAAVAEMKEWLREQLGPPYTGAFDTIGNRWSMVDHSVFLLSADDAFAFKMRWG